MVKILSIFFILISISGFSQKQSIDTKNLRHGYIITKNNEYKEGYILLGNEKDNFRFIDFYQYKNSSASRLDNSKISGYGSGDISYQIFYYNLDSVFMLKLTNKEPLLYYFKDEQGSKRFFIKKEELVLIPNEKHELRKFLYDELTNCDFVKKNFEKARYNKENLTYIFNRYSNCDSAKIPVLKYGVYLGYDLNYLTLNSNTVYIYGSDGYISLSDFKYKYNSGFLIGTFMDLPLTDFGGKLSFHPELEYSRVEYNYEKDWTNFGFDINYYTINGLFRYNNLKYKISTFGDFGFSYSYLDIKNSYINDYKLNHRMDQFVIGLVAGVGIDINNLLGFSIRTNYLIAESMPKVWNSELIISFKF